MGKVIRTTLDCPFTVGHELLRAGLDGDEKLAIALDPGPLREDPRLWGILLADVAGTVADTIGQAPEGTVEAAAAAAAGDVSDKELTRKLIAKAFTEAVSFGIGDNVQLARLGGGAEAVALGDLRSGDRFVSDNHLFLVIDGHPGEAVNLTHGSRHHFDTATRVVPVRRRRD